MSGDISALSAFFDPAAVASALKDAFDNHTQDSGRETADLPAVSSVCSVSDQAVLKQLLPQDVYADLRQAGYTGAYGMTFMLRHAVTFLALACHDRSCPAGAVEQVMNTYYPCQNRAAGADCVALLAGDAQPSASLPLLGFSALGIHGTFRTTGACRFFDYYAVDACQAPAAGIFCEKHAREAWWAYDAAGASTQAALFRFYGRQENLFAYGERELEELIGRFWSRLKVRRSLPSDTAVAEALAFFGYPAFSDVCSAGRLKLRQRYTERARRLHPDSGGGHESFLRLKRHYDVLRDRLSYENAADAL